MMTLAQHCWRPLQEAFPGSPDKDARLVLLFGSTRVLEEGTEAPHATH